MHNERAKNPCSSNRYARWPHEEKILRVDPEAVPADGRQRAGLRHLPARSAGQHHELEPGRAAHQAVHAPTKSSASTSRCSTRRPDIERELARSTSCSARRREGRFEDEGWRVRKDGSRFWANVVITALRDENGKLLGFSKITRDLTERKRQEEALRAERGALPPAGRGRAGLRDLHAEPRGHGHELERRRAPHQGLRGGRDHRQAFLALLPRRGHRRRQALGASSRWRASTAAPRTRAGACARTARGSGRAWWSPRCTTPTGGCAASPR